MERKLIKQGGGGYTIYLPKKWIDKKGLKEGDAIKIKETETNLIIGSDVKVKKAINVEINEENKDNIKNILTHIYRKTYNKITVTNIDPKILSEIKQITKDLLLGFEITEKKPNFCVLENISEPTQEKFDIMLRRIFLIIKETQDVILENFEKKKIKDLNEIEELRKQLDKFILFCRRLLTKEKYEKEIVLHWELLTFLMHIEHSYYYLYKFAIDYKIKPDKHTIELLKTLVEYFDLYYNAYYQKNLDYINKIHLLRNKYQFGKIPKLLEKGKNKNAILYSNIRQIFRLIQVGTSPIYSIIFE